MLVSVKSKKSSTGKLYSTFVLKATLKYLQAMRTSCLIVDPFLNTKYLLEYTDTKPKDKKYPVVFSADASALLTKLHTELYNELSELSYSSKCDLETLAETSSTETVYDYFGFMYRVVKNESAAICKKCPSIVDVSDDGYIVTNIINIVGQQRAQVSGAIADCICTFNKIIAHKIANHVWFDPSIVNQKVLLKILGGLYMSDMSLTNLYVEPTKNSIDELVQNFIASKSEQIAILPETSPTPAIIGVANPVVVPVVTAAKIAMSDADLDATLRSLNI